MSIDGQTQLVGIVGWPISHSLSPEMHNAAFAYIGLNWRYVPLPVRESDLVTAVRGLAALGFRGVNITVPHKVNVIPLLRSVSDAAQTAGAVNTIQIDRNTGELDGLNTDVNGFLSDLAANSVRIDNKSRVVLLGAGGAARACAAGLLRSNAQVTIVNRTADRAEHIVNFLRASWMQANVASASIDELPALAENATLVVNATSAGMWPDVEATPWPEGVPFPATATLYDTIYRPLKTRLMRDAEKAGARAIGGLGMLVYQGGAAFEAWTGRKAPLDVMKMICLSALSDE